MGRIHQQARALRNRRLVVLLLAGLALTATGCEMDSYLNPSITGRWEHTPVVLPILDRIDVIEEPADTMPGLSPVRTEDLIPEIAEYRIGPGDLITVTVFELITVGVESVQTDRVDTLGNIHLAVIGTVQASGLTARQLEQRIIDIVHPSIIAQEPMVRVILQERRQNRYSMMGAVGAPGPYTLLENDLRLLDAIARARNIPANAQKIYVIRQVPLSALWEKGWVKQDMAPGEHWPPLTPSDGDDDGGIGEPGEGPDVEEFMKQFGDELDSAAPEGDEGETAAPPTDVGTELIEAIEPPEDRGRWVNIAGRWVMVTGDEVPTAAPTAPAGAEAAPAEGLLPSLDQMATQRIIEIDARRLVKGEAKYNIVVRPGDIIRVPPPNTGNIYMGGQIARRGTYVLPGDSRLTLKQAVTAAGGLGGLAVPERVDLTRRISDHTEATVRLNFRAIADGVEPDIYLKPDDQINVGTSILMPLVAVLRNSFRMTYGFGFLLDRNFDNAVYGARGGGNN